jgi:hypothetical protein
MLWPFGKRYDQNRRLAREQELAEMENRNRETAAKVDELTRILQEISERKRGANAR